jgi:uncharacterized repeat protein (TIGR02543 family)
MKITTSLIKLFLQLFLSIQLFIFVFSTTQVSAQTYPLLPALTWEVRSDWLNVKALPSTVNGGVSAKGDGVTNDTQAIQKAFEAVRSGTTYSTVYFPAGTYKITSTIYPPNVGKDKAMHLRGCGRNTKIVWYGPTGGRMFRSDAAPYSTYTGVIWDGRGIAADGFIHATSLVDHRETKVIHKHNAYMNFTNQGSGTAPNKPDQAHLEASSWKNCLFIRCGKGMGIAQSNDYVITLDGCEFYDNYYGVWCGSGNFYVRNSHFERSKTTDIHLNASSPNSSARRVTSYGSKAFLIRPNTSGAQFIMQDCHISNWTNTAYAVRASSAARQPLLIFDCSFKNAPAGAQPPIRLDGATALVHSNNVWTTGGAFVGGNTTYVQQIPPGTRGGSLTSATQKFFKSTVSIPGKVFKAAGFTSAAIQKAVDDARAYGNGAIAYLPRGNYNLSVPINISGGNYSIGGAGMTMTRIYRTNPLTQSTPDFIITNPQQITIENLGFWCPGNDNKKGNPSRAYIQVTSTNTTAANLKIEDVYAHSPVRPGIPTTNSGDLWVKNLANGSTLILNSFFTAAYTNGQLLFENSSGAKIMCNHAEGAIIIKGTTAARTGFFGVQSHQGAISILDNHSMVASESYFEQGEHEYVRLKGSSAIPAGRVTIDAVKIHTWKARDVGWQDDFIIDNYKGTLSLVGSRSSSTNEPRAVYNIVRTGTNPLDLVYLNNLYFDAAPTFNLGTTGVNRTVIGSWVDRSSANGGPYAVPNVTHANSMLQASQALDDFRKLGAYDLTINHGATGLALVKRKAVADTTSSSYAISYNANGGTGTIADTTKIHDVNFVLSNGSGLTREGYTFTGWISEFGDVYEPGATYSTNASEVFYADWRINSYSITYNANGGAGSVDSDSKLYNDSLSLSTGSGFSRARYTFAGWNTLADGSGVDYAAGALFSINAPQTFYAKWTTTLPVVTVTESFNTSATTATNGWSGSGNTTSPDNFTWANTDVVLGTGTGGAVGGVFSRKTDYSYFADMNICTFDRRTDTLTLSGSFRLVNNNFDGIVKLGYFNPSDPGNNFIGFAFAEPSGSSDFRGYASVNDITKSSYISLPQSTTYSFNLTWIGNADGSGTLSGTIAGQNVSVTDTAGTGTFTAFGLLNGGMGNSSSVITGNCYFDNLSYRKVNNIPTYNLSYNANGGTGSIDNATKVHDEDVILSDGSNLSRSGYTFSGWNALANGSGTYYAETSPYSINVDQTFYAQWTANTYTLSYNPNGGSGFIADTTKMYDVNLTLADGNALARAGYTFAGWNTQEDGTGTDYAANAAYSTNESQMFNAKWTPNAENPVIYNANGGAGNIADASKLYNVDLTLSDGTGFSRVRYTFEGWNTFADGSGYDYEAGAVYDINEPITFYAKWTTTSTVAAVTEPFNSSSSTATNGWSGSGNTTSPNNFTWANTDVVLGTGTGGAVGGVFSRKTAYSYFADLNIGTFDRRTDTLNLSGSFRLVNNNFDGIVKLGYFNPSDPGNNFIGFAFAEPSGSSDFRGYASVNGTTNSGYISLPQSTTYSFNLTWIGNTDGSGTLSGTIAGQNVSVTDTAGTGTFTAFGLLNGGMGTSSSVKTGNCYFDDLTYYHVAGAQFAKFHPDKMVDEINGEQISIFPNPSTDRIYFKNLSAKCYVELVDMLGRSLLVKSASEVSGGLSLQMMNNGLYVVRIIQEDKVVQTLKIVKN